jgi:hypothetical protein
MIGDSISIGRLDRYAVPELPGELVKVLPDFDAALQPT